ncbi:MAG TPA: alpha/beta hydrolase-fold protein [Terriglobia bacterium]|nr:alpha/beta hydrolase-fold protein [Terriglobia bacterium]
MRSGIKESFAHYFRSFAGIDRRDVLKVLGSGALAAPVAAALNPLRAQAAVSPMPLDPAMAAAGDPAKEHQETFNPCGTPRAPKKFTGPFETKHSTYVVSSAHQAYDLPLRVLLPERLETLESPRVLYVLPAYPNIRFKIGDGLLMVERENLHNKYGLIAVAPAFSDWPWYANHPKNPTLQQETYFVEEIVPFIDNLYPKASKARLLLGMSKSGNGAFQMLLRHPEVFAAAAIFDSPLMYNSATQFEAADIYGDNANFAANYCIPQLLMERADLFRGKPPRLALFGYCLFGGPHPKFGPHLQMAHALLDSLSIRHIYDQGSCRDHRWDSGWLEGAVAALDKMARDS